jgi:hypothetical protein
MSACCMLHVTHVCLQEYIVRNIFLATQAQTANIYSQRIANESNFAQTRNICVYKLNDGCKKLIVTLFLYWGQW